MVRLLWIGFGGFVGTCLRYGLTVGSVKLIGPGFPYGTLAVNLMGSFALGALTWLAAHTSLMSPTARLVLSVGCLGGFTTYSSFNQETLQLLQQRAWPLGVANILITVGGCLVAGLLGWGAAAVVSSR